MHNDLAPNIYIAKIMLPLHYRVMNPFDTVGGKITQNNYG